MYPIRVELLVEDKVCLVRMTTFGDYAKCNASLMISERAKKVNRDS